MGECERGNANFCLNCSLRLACHKKRKDTTSGGVARLKDGRTACPAVSDGRELPLAAGCRCGASGGQGPKHERAETSQPTDQRLPRLQRILVDDAARVTCSARRIRDHAVDCLFRRLSAAAQKKRERSVDAHAAALRALATEPARIAPSHVTSVSHEEGSAVSAHLKFRSPKCARNQTRRASAVVNHLG